MFYFKAAQPALFYLVPACLGATGLTALWRKGACLVSGRLRIDWWLVEAVVAFAVLFFQACFILSFFSEALVRLVTHDGMEWTWQYGME